MHEQYCLVAAHVYELPSHRFPAIGPRFVELKTVIRAFMSQLHLQAHSDHCAPHSLPGGCLYLGAEKVRPSGTLAQI